MQKLRIFNKATISELSELQEGDILELSDGRRHIAIPDAADIDVGSACERCSLHDTDYCDKFQCSGYHFNKYFPMKALTLFGVRFQQHNI